MATDNVATIRTCRCGCGTPLTEAQLYWADDSHRKRASRSEGTVSQSEALSRVAQLLADNGIEPENIGKVEKIRFNDWEVITKGADGEPVSTTARASSILLSPAWVDGPAWDTVSQAPAAKIKYPSKPKAAKPDGTRVMVVFPDPQFGFRRSLEDGSLTPFHDEHALDVALQIARYVEADDALNLGDGLDLAEAGDGKYIQEPEFANTINLQTTRYHQFLADQRVIIGEDGKLIVLEGNHDRRLINSVIRNLKYAYNLKQAGPVPQNWPVLSVPFLVNMESLGVEYVGGYPAGRYWINDRLVAAHGPSKFRSGGSSAAASVDDERVSLLFGHTHRLEQVLKTRATRKGPRTVMSASPGCLCRIDGAVPSFKSSTVNGEFVKIAEDWQQGVAVVTYTEGDGPFAVELVHIYEGQAIFRGRSFESTYAE